MFVRSFITPVLMLGLFSVSAQAQIIVPPIENSNCDITSESSYTDDYEAANQPNPIWVDDHVVSYLADEVGLLLDEMSLELGQAAIDRVWLKSAFMAYCQASKDQIQKRQLEQEFELGFAPGSLGEAAAWAAAGNYLMDDEDGDAMAALFLEKAAHAVRFDDYDHQAWGDDEANEDILYFQYQLISDRAYLARVTGRYKDVDRNGKIFQRLLEDHHRHTGTTSEVAPEMIVLQMIEDLAAAGFRERADKVFQSELTSSFDGMGAIRNSGPVDSRRLYGFLVSNSFHIKSPEDYIISLRHESLITAIPPGRVSQEHDWRYLREADDKRLAMLETLLPDDHPILVRDRFYNEIYQQAHGAIDVYLWDRSHAERQADGGGHIWNAEKLERLSETVATWKERFIETENLHPHDLAERLREIHILEHWLKITHPKLSADPGSSLDYILQNISGLHDNVEGAVREDLAKTLISEPYYRDRFDRDGYKADPLYKLFHLVGCEGRTD